MASQIPNREIQMDAPRLNEEELNQIYNWVDEIPLSRPKKNITRDFADGCMVAEIIHHHFPKIIEIHNYSLAHSVQQKLYNWNTLNQKVFKKMGFQISKRDIDHIVSNTPDAIERVLKVVQIKIAKYREIQASKAHNSQNSIDYNQGGNEYVPNQGPQQPYRNQPPVNQHHPQQQYQFNDYVNPNDVKGILVERDNTINELRSTIEILELKIKKMEQLVKLKDSKIQTLINKLAQFGGGGAVK